MELRSQDVRVMLDLGQRALACETMPELQKAMLRGMEELVGSESSVCFDVASTSLGWQFVDGQSFGVAKSALSNWCRDYQAQDPFVIHLARYFRSGDRKVLTSDQLRSFLNFEENEFYNEFLKPQSIYHIMTIGLDKSNLQSAVPGGMIGLHRPRKSAPFSEGDIARVKAVLPHYSTALQLVQLRDMSFERQAIIEVLSKEAPLCGIMILNQDFVPTYVDKDVLELLGFQMPVDNHLPETISKTLPQLIRQGCTDLKNRLSTGTICAAERQIKFVANQTEQPVPCRIYARTDKFRPPHFIVCFHQTPEGSAQPSGFQKYDLTPREVEVAQLVIKGMTNPQVANALGISVRTVQNHLRAIYVKVSVNNRTSLVSRLFAHNPPQHMQAH